MILEPSALTTRAHAAELGVKLYYNGRPCRRGHHSARYTSTGQCVECTRIYNGARSAGPLTQRVLVKVANKEDAFRIFLFAEQLQREREQSSQEAVALHNKLMAQKLEMEQRQHLAEFNARLSTR